MKKTPIALSIAAALGAASVDAAQIPVVLTTVFNESRNGTSQGYLTGDTATWIFDTVSQRVMQTGGTHQATYFVGGFSRLLDHFMNDLQIGNGLAASATSWSCVEGSFGVTVGASICGNYGFGGNSSNDSATMWGPGTAFARTIGGDDEVIGAQHNLSFFDGMTTSWNGSTVVISNRAPGGDDTYEYTFSAVPVPAAIWLFGSALGLLGWLRRR